MLRRSIKGVRERDTLSNFGNIDKKASQLHAVTVTSRHDTDVVRIQPIPLHRLFSHPLDTKVQKPARKLTAKRKELTRIETDLE